MSPPVGQGEGTGGWSLLSAARPFFGLILLTTALLAVAGIYAALRMPRGIYPEVAFPRIAVIVQSPNVSGTKEVENGVTRPIEDAVSVVLGVERLRSKSMRGAAEIHVDFVPGTEMVQALNDVRAKVAETQPQFPPGTQTIVERETPSIFPIIHFAVTGGDDPAALHDYAYYDLQRRIKAIKDVSYVTVTGGDVREILVEVDPDRLVAAELSLAEVADRLGEEHRARTVGRIDPGTQQYQVIVNTQVRGPLELEDRVIGWKNGRPLRVRDVGRVAVSRADRTVAVRCNGKDAVAVSVFRRLGGDALSVSRDLARVLEDARKGAPPGMEIVQVYDQGQLVRTAIDNCWACAPFPDSRTFARQTPMKRLRHGGWLWSARDRASSPSHGRTCRSSIRRCMTCMPV